VTSLSIDCSNYKEEFPCMEALLSLGMNPNTRQTPDQVEKMRQCDVTDGEE
jgi:hypothetical protein